MNDIDRNRRTMRLLARAGLMLALAVACPAQADADVFTANFIVDPHAAPPDEPTTTRSGKMLISVDVRHPGAAKLLEPVDAESAASMQASADYPLQAGQILVALPGSANTYCAVMERRGLGEAAPCLVDLDGDGRFETIEKAGFTTAGAEALLIDHESKIVAATLSRPQSLPHPVPYATIPYGDGPPAAGRLVWQAFGKNNITGRPGRIDLWIEAGEDSAGTGVLSLPVSLLTPPDGSVIDVNGLQLRILGFDENGSIRWTVQSMPAEQRVTFGFRPARQTIYIYIPHG